MKRQIRKIANQTTLLLLLIGLAPLAARGDDHQISLAEGKLLLQAPAAWVVKRPSSGIVEFEFAIPKAEGDESDGRMTVMGAGGSIDANIDRWRGQFRDENGRALDKAAVKIEKQKIAKIDVTVVDISGTFIDKPNGPFAPGPAVKRPDYRMLAAIVQTKNAGNYFFKFYGPAKTVQENEQAFRQMLASLVTK
jgi:hypothetical protein